MKVLAVAGFLVVFMILGSVSPASGQSVILQVTESETGNPIPGAFVSLLDSGGTPLRRALADRSGRFLFLIPGPGTYVVKAEMIGRGSAISAPIRIESAESIQQTLALEVSVIPLKQIAVRGERRCSVRPETGLVAAQLWDEARKALGATRWTQAHYPYTYQLRSYERDLALPTMAVQAERTQDREMFTRNPIRGLSPEGLVAEGYIRRLDDGAHDFFAPDAEVLLSDAFLDTHCFRVLPGDQGDDTSVGLAFEPLPDSEVPDIEGVFWLDKETARLSRVEFTYTQVPGGIEDPRIGGEIGFEGLPNGTWIVRRWFIRMPVLGVGSEWAGSGLDEMRSTTGARPRLIGLREAGGEITEIVDRDFGTIVTSESAALVGEVFDSTAGGPLENARVLLSGTEYSALSEPDGRFHITGVPAGAYHVTFNHPRLDSLGIELPDVVVSLDRGFTTAAQLAIPSIPTLLAATCPEELAQEGQAPTQPDRAAAQHITGREGATGRGRTAGESPAGVVVGMVRDRDTGIPVRGAAVRVVWESLGISGGDLVAVGKRQRWIDATTNERGQFSACGVPPEKPLRVSAGFLGVVSAGVEVQASSGKPAMVDLELDLKGFSVSQAGATPSRLTGSGPVQMLRGRVLEDGAQEPIRSAAVSAIRVGQETVQTSLSDSAGVFRILVPDSGQYILQAEALGYHTSVGPPVRVGPGEVLEVELRMAVDAIPLEPLLVVVEARSLRLDAVGFFERFSHTSGKFLSKRNIETRAPSRLTDLMKGMPGVLVRPGPSGGSSYDVRFLRALQSRFKGDCAPSIWLDGILVRPGGESIFAGLLALDDVVQPSEVEGIELYHRASSTPVGYNTGGASCGVILVWTR